MTDPLAARGITFCQFGHDTLLRRLPPLAQEIQGALNGDDIEYIHRLRVASRRLRAALNVFAECLPPERFRQWRKQARRTTRALGAARDADVQIAYLDTLAQQIEGSRHRAGVDRLRLRLQQARAARQAAVSKTLRRLQKGDLLAEMQSELLPLPTDPPPGAIRMEYESGLYQNAYLFVSYRLQELLAYETHVAHPDRALELHEMRIAAKRLRYTLEIFAPAYNGALDRFAESVRALQQSLGDLHDCDVWLEFLPVFTEDERARTMAYFGHDRPMRRLTGGLVLVREDRQQQRDSAYRQFAGQWQAMAEAGLWRDLLQTMQERVNDSILREQSSQADLENRPVKVALLADVHANLPALEAVLTHARAHGAHAIWHAGDAVGYGAFPDEVVQRLRQENALGIVGNYDLKVLQVKRQKKKWRKSKHPQKLLAFEWAHDNLSFASRNYLQRLPQQLRLKAGGQPVLIVHGSPAGINESITPQTPDERLRELAVDGASVIICGHSHQPFARKVGGVWFINPGSVGRPDDGNPRASYALLSLHPNRVRVTHYRVDYDSAQAANAQRARGLPEAFATMTERGLSLDEVEPA